MIALWRRMRKAVGGIGDTEWALLGLELVGVVGGILLAFQMQEWAEDRREDRDRERLLERLFEESEANTAWLYNFYIDRVDEVEAARPVVATLARRECPSSEALGPVVALTIFPPVEFQHVVLDELRAGIGLSGLQDETLATLIGNFQADSDYRRAQTDVFRDVDEVIGSDTPYVDVTTKETGDIDFDVDMDALCSDRQFRTRAAFAMFNKQRYAGFTESTVARGYALCTALGDRVGRSCTPDLGKHAGRPEWTQIEERAATMRERAQ